jgi:membrane protein implicated in regulation of membrane protease activity
MTASWIAGLGAWAWIILGVVLIGLELAAPGIFLLWFGLAAIATGLIDGAMGLSWQASALLFAVFAVAAAMVGRLVTRSAVRQETASLNQRGEALVGQVFVLETPMTRGEGRIRVGDSSWRATGPDLPQGARVRVVRVDGATLVIEVA